MSCLSGAERRLNTSPSSFLPQDKVPEFARMTPEELGTWCLRYTDPSFRSRVKDEGLNVVVAGDACGVA